eukprot:1266986-Amphidinium_carterae.3
MGKKPDHSRAMTDIELLQLCHILLSMFDPALYPQVKAIIDDDNNLKRRRNSWTWWSGWARRWLESLDTIRLA